MTNSYRCNLDKVMIEQGRTNVWLARIVGVTEQSVCSWRGGKLPSPKYMPRIAESLETTVEYLFFAKGVDNYINTA